MYAKAKIIALLVGVSIATAYTADWPGYLGPKRDGTSTEKGLLRTWPKQGPKVLWTVPLGVGFGGPAVSRGRVYLLDRDDKVGDTLRVYDLKTGKELWNFAYDAPGSFTFTGSRTVPTIDGDLVYICGPLGDLYAININTRKPVWHKNVWTDFGGGSGLPAIIPTPPGMRGVPSAPPAVPAPAGQRGGQREGAPAGAPPTPPAGQAGGRAGAPGAPTGPPPAGQRAAGPAGPPGLPIWAITQNPLIYHSLVIVASQAPDAGVVAFDKLSGELKWKTPSLGGVGYVSPALVKVGDEDHLVWVTASRGFGRNASGGGASGIDPLSGTVLWRYENFKCSIPVPSAVDAGEGRVLLTGAYGAGSAMLKVQKKADGTYDVAELFKNPDFGSHTQPPILYKDHFYVQYTINERSDGLVCMTMGGQVKWKTGEEPLFSKGGAVLADGLLLATDGNKMLYLIEPDPSAFKPLASAELLESADNWAPLALADGKLLIRDQKHMKCLQVAQSGR